MTETTKKSNIVAWTFDIWQHVLSNRISSISIIFVNLFMIGGVLFKDWSVFAIMFLYWAENVINGVFSVIRMVSAKNGGCFKAFLVPFFCIHYGMFCFVHGIFVVAIFGTNIFGASSGSANTMVDSYLNGSFWHQLLNIFPGLGWTLLFFIVNNTFTLIKDYFYNGEYLQADLNKLMNEPYGRIVQLHIALIAGGFLTILTGSTKITICILILLKTMLDLNYSLNAKKKMEVINHPLPPP